MYIEQRRRRWYAVLDVPKDVADVLNVPNNRFLQSLKTESKTEAQRLALPVVAGWKLRIDRARKSLKGDAVDQEAASWREALTEVGDDDEEAKEAILDVLADRARAVVEASAPKGEIGRPGETEWEALPGHVDAQRLFDTATGKIVRTADYIEPYLESLGDKNTAKTIDIKRADLSKLVTRFPTLQQINDEDVEDWLTAAAEGGRARATVNRTLSACRGYWKFLQRRAKVVPRSHQPFNVEFEGGTTTERRPFKTEEVVALLHAAEAKADDSLADLTRLAMYTGARIEDLCALKLEQVDLAKKSVTILKSKTSAGMRVVPIHSMLMPVIKELIKKSEKQGCDRLLSGTTPNKYGDYSNAIGKRFGRLKTDQGFGKDKTFHSIRHTLVTLLYHAGVSEGIAADIVGHKKSTITYGLYSDVALLKLKADALEKVSYPPHS